MAERKRNEACFLLSFPRSFTLHCVTSQITVVSRQTLISHQVNVDNTPFEIEGEVLRRKVMQVALHEGAES
jgi:hypothetical protein